jgi:hypothetical protein
MLSGVGRSNVKPSIVVEVCDRNVVWNACNRDNIVFHETPVTETVENLDQIFVAAVVADADYNVEDAVVIDVGEC